MIDGRAASQRAGARRPGEKYQQTDTRRVVIPYCFKWEYSRDKKRRRESFKMWVTSTDLPQSAVSAAEFLRLTAKFLFPGVELPGLRLMDWPDAQLIATISASAVCICLCLFALKGRPAARTGSRWRQLIRNEMHNIATDSCCTLLSTRPNQD